jgi:DNA ligase-1
MLASPATDVAAAIDATGEASVEWKLDGARVQAHRRGSEVRLFTRNLNDVTDRLSGVVELVRSLPGGDLVLDGEVLGVLDDGTPRRFQDTMGDFGADTPGRGSGLAPFFFDVLHVGGDAVVAEPLSVRRELLAAVVPSVARLPSIVTADPDEAQRFLDAAVASGHEGVMVKDLAATYDAGRRGGAWRKVKPVHTLDLVVLAVEWGHGGVPGGCRTCTSAPGGATVVS